MTNIQDFTRNIARFVDRGRFDRAMKMLRKDSFSLFVKKEEGRIYGIVKSQTNKELIYAVSITTNGIYFCGTQNLRVCGGLRGAICKHLLLLLMAAVKSSILSIDEASMSVKNTIARRPMWNKQEAEKIFSEYELSKNTELEWRPVEILPEDLVAW